jgi:opacity protein-like surface antigen
VTIKCRGLIALLAALCEGPAAADEPRVALHANVALAAGELSFGTTRTLSVLSRDVSVRANYTLDAALGFDLGLQVALTNNVALRASFSRVTREGNGVLHAELPSLPFGLPRDVDATLPDGRVEERAGHLDLVLGGGTGPVRGSVFGGLTLFDLDARLLGPAAIMVPGLPPIPIGTRAPLETSDSTTGWNAGLGLDVRVSAHLALGAFLRYAHARATLDPPGFEPIEVDAGGAHAAAGVRVSF